jgi:hypothetical protein
MPKSALGRGVVLLAGTPFIGLVLDGGATCFLGGLALVAVFFFGASAIETVANPKTALGLLATFAGLLLFKGATVIFGAGVALGVATFFFLSLSPALTGVATGLSITACAAKALLERTVLAKGAKAEVEAIKQARRKEERIFRGCFVCCEKSVKTEIQITKSSLKI